MRKLAVFFLLCTIALAIGFVFWKQEIKYATPTPLPETYQPVPFNYFVNIDSLLQKKHSKPVHLHFYNPECPCSKFNTDHFNTLLQAYQNRIEFYVVIPTAAHYESTLRKFGKRATIVVDNEELLANALGVYATPQAVLVDTKGSLYYRGNYNRSRYCTDPATNFAQMAIEALLAGQAAPRFTTLATTAYGCELTEKNTFNFSLF